MPALWVRVLSDEWFTYNLADVPKNDGGPTVLSTFSGGGGSSMGYRLAGFNVIGAVEIDPKMAAVYAANLKTRVYNEPISAFIERMKSEPIRVDVLDGSPPCSVFSMAGKREAGWGVKKKFAEGQALQRLDNLFFEFIDLAEVIRPRVIVAENVTGMLRGNAKGYLLEIFAAFRRIGYEPKLYKLNAARMGVPQTRQRIIFIAAPECAKIQMGDWTSKLIPAGKAVLGAAVGEKKWLSEARKRIWLQCRPNETFDTYSRSGAGFTWRRCASTLPFPTVTASVDELCHWSEPRALSSGEIARAQTFPDDYGFDRMAGRYVCGMSVPPLMMKAIATRIMHWLN